MNKNLKKVISTVAALAVSAGSLIASAANYPDVASTATYAQAVQELSALGVINGYEDGTFAPDKNVTRAEITKMIVTALGSSTLNAADAAKGKNTQFNDVPGTHWASGYVTVGTASGTQFINGYSATEFGPDDNVTYAQAIKMLVAALGYTTYAENNGGWPNGYLTYGYNLDITKGITGVANDTQVTRAQVAQMIDNAVKAPICVIDGYETQWNGTQTPKLVEKNTTSTATKNSWQCLLNYAHDAYVVNGRVKETHQSNDSVKADEVKISIEKSNNYDGYQVTSSVASTVKKSETAKIGESGADQYLFTYAEMLLQLNDDDDEITILSIVPAGSNKTEEFAAEDYADDADNAYDKATAGSATGTMYSYVSGSDTKKTSYKLDLDKLSNPDKGGFYVNGVQVTGTLKDNVDRYIKGNATGTVTLIDSPEDGTSSTDGKYDYIMVSYYQTAVVDSVTGDDEECTIIFSEMQVDSSSLDVDTTDEDKYYSFKLTDGTAIKPTELKENDVLSIAYTGNDFSSSNSYNVIVSRDTVEGKVTRVNPDSDPLKKEFTVNNTDYKLSYSNVDELKTGSEYTIYLDAFGKIAKAEETANSQNIGVLDSVYKSNGDQSYVSIIGLDGEKKSYTIKDTNYNDYYALCYSSALSDTNKVRRDLDKRVFGYSVSSSSNTLTLKSEDSKDPLTSGYYDAKKTTGTDGDAYKASTDKIGSIRLSDSLTTLLDFSEYNDDGSVSVMAKDSLEDDSNYKALAFNKMSDGTYQLVIITEGNTQISYKTDFYIFSKSYTTTDDDTDKTAISVYGAGEGAKEFVLDSDGVLPTTGLYEGTPIMVKKNSSGYVTGIYPLFNADLTSYKTFANAAIEAIKTGIENDSTVLNTTNLKSHLEKTATNHKSEWKFGMVYDKSSSSITLATKFDSDKITNVKTFDGKALADASYISNVDTLEEIDYDADAKVYVYSYKNRSGKQLRVSDGVASSVLGINANRNSFVTCDVNGNTVDFSAKTYFNWNDALVRPSDVNDSYGKISFALVKLVDGDATEVYVINPSSSK